MIFLYRALKIKSITVLVLGTVMLFSCKTNMKDVDAIGNRNGMPEMSGENMELFYSDSARLVTIRNRRTEPVKPFLGRSCRTGTPPVPILGLRSVVRSLPEGALISARR